MHSIASVRAPFAALGLLAMVVVGSMTAGAQGPAGTTAFDGARVIVGDGSAPIDNATIVVTGGRIAQVGPSGKVTVPAGATRVSLAGKTVMPTIVDTHVHLSTTRDALVADLRRRAYFGVRAAASRCPSRAGPTCPTG